MGKYFVTLTNWCRFPLSSLWEGHCGHGSWTEYGNPCCAPICFSHWGWKSANNVGTFCQNGKLQIVRSCVLSCEVWTGRQNCSGSMGLWSWHILDQSSRSCFLDLCHSEGREMLGAVWCHGGIHLLTYIYIVLLCTVTPSYLFFQQW